MCLQSMAVLSSDAGNSNILFLFSAEILYVQIVKFKNRRGKSCFCTAFLILEVFCTRARTRLMKFQLTQFLPKSAIFQELLNISQTAPGRYQFIAKLEREITHPLGVLTHTRKLLVSKGILYICGNQLHKLG